MKFLIVLLLAGACASKKPAMTQDSDVADVSVRESFEVSGDSDNLKAGGLRTVNFDYDSSSLNSTGKQTLKSNAEFLKKNPGTTIQVEGHCDERGGRQYNLALGEKRAKTVRDHLKALGIRPTRIKIISYGNERPISEGNTESYWSKNRRANFVILSK